MTKRYYKGQPISNSVYKRLKALEHNFEYIKEKDIKAIEQIARERVAKEKIIL